MATADEIPHLLLLAAPDAGWAVATGAGLHARGWSIAWAQSASTAMPALRRSLPDILVVDGAIGEGADLLLQELRAAPSTALTPVVLIDRGGGLPSGEVQAVLPAGVTVDELHDAAVAALGADLAASAPPAALLAEPDRLAAVHATGLLDGAGDPLFDCLTAIAAELLPADSARVTLVADDRQVFVSRTDRADGSHERSTPLSHSLCQWPVASGEPLVVGDARVDPLLALHQAVTELGAVAYLGTPLIVDGRALGTLCILDEQPRDWQPEDLDTLETIATATTAQLRLRLGGASDTLDAASEAIAALADLLGGHGEAMTAQCLTAMASALEHFAARMTAAPGS